MTNDGVVIDGLADTGAETQRRYRYQALYLASVAIEMLRDDPRLNVLWCEHVDDGIVLRADGKYACYQVKARATGQPPITAGEDDATGTLRVCAAIEDELGDQVAAYIFISSVGFNERKKDQSNLRHMVSLAVTGKQPEVLDKYVERVSKKIDVSQDLLRKVLKKLRPEDGPGLDDAVHRLRSRIRDLSTVGVPVLADFDSFGLDELADAIADEIQSASQLDCEDERAEVLAFMSDGDRARREARVRAKRFDKERIEDLISRRSAPHLLEAPLIRASGADGGATTARRKMNAGGLPAPVVANLISLKGSYEAELLRRSNRFDGDRAERDAAHVESVVATEANSAHAALDRSDGASFGRAMYERVESRLRERATDPSGYASVLGLKFEQLMGALAVVTGACRVWWTHDISFLEGTDE